MLFLLLLLLPDITCAITTHAQPLILENGVSGDLTATGSVYSSNCVISGGGRVMRCSASGGDNTLQLVFGGTTPSSGYMPGSYTLTCSDIESGGGSPGFIKRDRRFDIRDNGAFNQGTAFDVTDGAPPTLSAAFSGGTFTFGCISTSKRKILRLDLEYYAGGLQDP